MDEFSTQPPLVDDSGDAGREGVERESEASPPIESASCYPHFFKNAEEQEEHLEYLRMLPPPPSPPPPVDFSQFSFGFDSHVDATEILGSDNAKKWGGEYQAAVAPQAAEHKGLPEASGASDTEDAHD